MKRERYHKIHSKGKAEFNKVVIEWSSYNTHANIIDMLNNARYDGKTEVGFALPRLNGPGPIV
jgi:hypothetical protein